MIGKKYFIFMLFFSCALKAVDENKKAAEESKKSAAVKEEEFLKQPNFGKVYFTNQKPVSILTYDSAGKVYRAKFAFLINKNKETTYLAIEKVNAGSYQYAFFVEHSLVFRQEPSFTIEDFDLLLYDDGTYRIRSNHGVESYLAVPPVSRGNYQYAIFATEEYITQNNCQSRFKVIAQDGTAHKDFIIETLGENSSTLALNPVAMGSFQYPFFADYEYIEGQKSSSVVFDINTCR